MVKYKISVQKNPVFLNHVRRYDGINGSYILQHHTIKYVK